MYHIYV